jgi:uncharacterized protein
MAVQVSYPGVYIEEFAPGAPIQGVGTNTAAFIGVAERGPVNVPTKVNSWDQFTSLFGSQPVPGFYLWYAVQGFYQNGGQTCYVVRATNGAYQRMTLNDRNNPPANGNPVVTLQSREPRAVGFTANVVANPYLVNVPVYRPSANPAVAAVVGAMEVTVAAAGPITADQVANRFKPGDEVSFSVGTDRRVIAGVNGPTIRFTLALTTAVNPADSMRLASTAAGTRTIRLRPMGAGPLAAGQLVPGTILTFAQGASDTQIVESVVAEVLTEGAQGGFGPVSYRVTLRSGLTIPLDLAPAAAPAPTASSNEFDLAVSVGAINYPPYQRLSMDPSHPRYLIDMVTGDAGGVIDVSLIEPPPPSSIALALPRVGPALATAPAQPGTNENLAGLLAANFGTAIDTLRACDDVNFIAVPDRPTAAGQQMLTVQQALITHCELMADRFGVLDTDPGATLFGAPVGNILSMEQLRRGVDSTRGYAGLYGPWLRVTPDNDGPPIMVPSSGHVCGIFARSDASRGVHKAPANEIVNGALGVERRISLIEQGQLNMLGVNIVQVFQDGGRPILWGARTTATDLNWQYVNIRRLFLYLEESIQEGIRWAVFEPNNLELWQKLKRTLTDFLTRAWRDGALFGAKASEAFYVRIDDALNPFSEQALGRLHIEIGVRPSYPAEFIIVRIGIWDGGSDVSES